MFFFTNFDPKRAVDGLCRIEHAQSSWICQYMLDYTSLANLTHNISSDIKFILYSVLGKKFWTCLTLQMLLTKATEESHPLDSNILKCSWRNATSFLTWWEAFPQADDFQKRLHIRIALIQQKHMSSCRTSQNLVLARSLWNWNRIITLPNPPPTLQNSQTYYMYTAPPRPYHKLRVCWKRKRQRRCPVLDLGL